jgi:putative (di)nucleoside polyphosphate hydrolase
MASSASSSSSSSSSANDDDDGRRWRPCAGAAVLNSKNEILVGERLGKPGMWQAPQGGIDGSDESATDAAIRELYEEVGLVNGRDVLAEEGTTTTDASTTTTTAAVVVKCKYETGGTGSWLEEEGYAGQELHWVVFRCASSLLETDPTAACDLSGMNGEKPEFSAVRWETLDRVVDEIWEQKSPPYRALREHCAPLMERWEGRCAEFDLGGRWSRDNARNVGVEEALEARGMSVMDAKRKASEPYVQNWRRHDGRRGEWIATTYYGAGTGGNDEQPRRELHYPMGEFEEGYSGTSAIFGGNGGGDVVRRNCFYLAESHADGGIAHVTVTDTPLGKEESMRYVNKDGELVLRRTFSPSSCGTENRVVSTEIFTKC